jgi:hypothetical protein
MTITLELHWINGARRHFLLSLLGVQLSKRRILLRHHRSSSLVVREVRKCTDSTFLLQVASVCAALLLSFHQQQCQSENRSEPEEAARDAYACLSPGAETARLVVAVARWGWGRDDACARLRCS